jgi:hypothetical protein
VGVPIEGAPPTWNDISSQESIHRRGIVAYAGVRPDKRPQRPPRWGPLQPRVDHKLRIIGRHNAAVSSGRPRHLAHGAAARVPHTPTKTRLTPAPWRADFYSGAGVRLGLYPPLELVPRCGSPGWPPS